MSGFLHTGLRVALLVLLGAIPLPGAIAPALAQSAYPVSLPVYGNWCGPDYPANPARAAPPVDALDAACMRHDMCTAARGSFDCGCDLGLLNELRATRWPNPLIGRNARAIYDAIALTPCNSPGGMAAKQSMFAADLFGDMATGRGTPMDVVDRWRQIITGR